MKAIINANNINQVINADVVNLENVKELSDGEKDKILNDLISQIGEQLNKIMDNPREITVESLNSMAQKACEDIREISTKDEESKNKSKERIIKIISDIKSSVGDVSDIIFKVIKTAQLLGI